MATITPGTTFYDGQTVSHTDLNTALTSATLSSISLADLASTLRGVTVSGSAPSSPSTGDLWYDTANDWLRIYVSSVWTVIGPTRLEAVITLASGVSGSEGWGVEVDTGNAGKMKLATSGTQRFVGVCAGTISSGSSGRIVMLGVGNIAVNSSAAAAISNGDFVKIDSSYAGYFQGDSTRTGTDWYYGIALETIAKGSIGAAWIWGRPTQ